MSETNIKNMGVGIVGAGLIGWRRAEVIKASKKGKLLAVTDVDFEKAKKLAEKYNCQACQSWSDLFKKEDVKIVIVAVPNKFAAPISIAALKKNKHVFCEKPLGRNANEAKKVLTVVKKYKKVFKVGFNHRFHAAVAQAKKIFDEGGIGELMFIRARYGYGGRFGMEKEWRMDKNISGGGELLDQGVHIIDLVRWFGGEPKQVYGLVQTKFWQTQVDDNAFAIMSNDNVTAEFHVSSTNWKNIFSFEIFGDKGYLEISGKGGSYGEEILIWGRRRKKFGVPKIKIFKFGKDISWEREWLNFFNGIVKKTKINGDTNDGYAANKIVEAIYKSAIIKKVVDLN